VSSTCCEHPSIHLQEDLYRVTDGNRMFLKWLVGGSYVRKGGEPAVVGLAIQCHFSSYGAVDGRALHVCLWCICAKWWVCHSSAAAFLHSFQAWTPGHRSQPQYDSQVDSQSEDNRSIVKKKPPGLNKTVRMPENIERVRQALIRNPGRSARRHAREMR